MKRRALTSLFVLPLLALLVACGTTGTPANDGTGGGNGTDSYAIVRPYAERALALATMQYGLGLMASVGMSDLPPVDFGGFTLERHTLTWLGILGIELFPALAPQGTVTTLRGGDGDADGYPWVVRSYDLSGALPDGSSFVLSGVAGLGELVADDDGGTVAQVFDAGAEGSPLVLEVTSPAEGKVARWKVGDHTHTEWSQIPSAIDYSPALEVEVEQQGVVAGRVELGVPAGSGPLQATYESTGTYELRPHPSGDLILTVTAGATTYGPVQLTPAASASAPLVLDWQCSVSGSSTAGLISGKVYYLDPSGNAVALVTVQGCGQYEVETFF